MTTSTHTEPGALTHAAFFYCSERHYLDEVASFVADGLRVEQPVLVAAPQENLALLSGALGRAATRVAMADIREVGRNPGALLGMLDTFVEQHSGRRVRIVGEPVWPGRTADEYPGCVRFEALVNTAMAGREITGICPYSADMLGGTALADARTTHPWLWNAGSARPNTAYAPEDALARYNQPLPGDPSALTYAVEGFADLSPLRSFATRCAARLGLPGSRMVDLQLIVTELATNSLEHAGGCCQSAFWQRDGHLVCEVSDNGRLTDPLAGRRRPGERAATGRGLFVVNSVADLVRTHAAPNGTTIQAFLRLDPARAVIT